MVPLGLWAERKDVNKNESSFSCSKFKVYTQQFSSKIFKSIYKGFRL